jgi:NhaP-type Na+/H+ or K+/H+ antiporter
LSEVASVLAIAGAIITIGFTANVYLRKAGIPDVLFLIFTGIIFGPLLNIFSPKQLLPLVPVFYSSSFIPNSLSWRLVYEKSARLYRRVLEQQL